MLGCYLDLCHDRNRCLHRGLNVVFLSDLKTLELVVAVVLIVENFLTVKKIVTSAKVVLSIFFYFLTVFRRCDVLSTQLL